MDIKEKIMKFRFIIYSLIGLGMISACATESLQNKVSSKYDNQVFSFHILENGHKRVMNVPNQDDFLDRHEGIIVRFSNDTSPEELTEFASSNGLHLKAKLVAGYYVFENKSNDSDIFTINNIMKRAKNITYLRPNWKSNFKPL
jgi:hypothetical protein